MAKPEVWRTVAGNYMVKVGPDIIPVLAREWIAELVDAQNNLGDGRDERYREDMWQAAVTVAVRFVKTRHGLPE